MPPPAEAVLARRVGLALRTVVCVGAVAAACLSALATFAAFTLVARAVCVVEPRIAERRVRRALPSVALREAAFRALLARVLRVGFAGAPWLFCWPAAWLFWVPDAGSELARHAEVRVFCLVCRLFSMTPILSNRNGRLARRTIPPSGFQKACVMIGFFIGF